MESKNIFVLLSELRSEYFVLLYVWWPFPLILGAKKVGKMSSYVSTEYDYVTVGNRKKQWQLFLVVEILIQRKTKHSDHMSACIFM